jgi:hypothetical protein
MTSQTDGAQVADRRKADLRTETLGWNIYLVVVSVMLVAGFLQIHPIGFNGYSTENLFGLMGIPNKHLYKPGDDFGFYLGLVGGLMMLSLLFYSMRKRFGFMKGLGLLPKWFKWHMISGILGPVLIMFHSTFIIHSINAGVAEISMLLVGGSGVFGRFFYTKIHRGLYGRQATLKGKQEEMAKTGSFDQSFVLFAPELENKLDAFRIDVQGKDSGLANFLLIGIQSVLLSRKLRKELRHKMYTQAEDKQWDTGLAKQNVDLLYKEYSHHIRDYIKAITDVVQFRTYERLFSLWHIFHIPLVYMLVFSGLYHVIAVEFMY